VEADPGGWRRAGTIGFGEGSNPLASGAREARGSTGEPDKDSTTGCSSAGERWSGGPEAAGAAPASPTEREGAVRFRAHSMTAGRDSHQDGIGVADAHPSPCLRA
jgi:hypothetical protein